MIDLAPRLCDVGSGPKGSGHSHRGLATKRKLYELDGLDLGLQAAPCKRRRPAALASSGTRLVDLQILGEDGALVQEATIEEIWAPHATRLEIVVVDENWGASSATVSPAHDEEATLIDLDDPMLGPLGPLGGTSALHGAILREAQQHQHAAHPAPGPRGGTGSASSAQDAPDSDFGNLDWLINFKVDSVFEPKKQRGKQAGGCSPSAATTAGASPTTAVGRSASPRATTATPAALAVTSTAVAAAPPPASPHPAAHRYSGPGKPPFTYTELIELALKDKGKLTVKEIYQWITKHFPFYQASDERWKNSVRHNLSINPHFRKESKAPQGAGHLWVVMDNNNKAKNSWKEERIQNFLAAQISAAAAEEAAASAAAEASAAAAAVRAAEDAERAAAAAASKSPERPPTPPSPITTGAKGQNQLNAWWSERISLERSAEEILSGVKREVGVEFLTPMDLDGDLDGDDMKLDVKDEKGFLYGDLTAEQVIAESGLQDELAGLYLLNDMTMAMTSMTSSITPDSLFPDDLNLGGLELPLSG
ncbi:hypothetical protein ONE63_009216 [Megalurothrips usitatus]|uniref:Fork-head domain-containing protein n=1 Tax=Megalurothrips usitatus TaxID=439358 RepID=A0AAV7XQL4_9NEOP|nr:hypothetical protein ONE63_009216 [Megalurothrips usitatus]